MSTDVPGQPGAPGSIVEIRPARPAGRLYPPEKWFLEHWRMLLLDREGRQAGAGMRRYNPQALRLFPPDVFEPLTTVGIRVVSEWHDSARALEDAHPGAVGRLALIGESRSKTAAIGVTAALVIFIITGVTVYLFTH